MFRIAALEFATDGGIVTLPEARQILCYLDGASVGRKEMNGEVDPAGADGRRCPHSEEILQPGLNPG